MDGCALEAKPCMMLWRIEYRTCLWMSHSLIFLAFVLPLRLSYSTGLVLFLAYPRLLFPIFLDLSHSSPHTRSGYAGARYLGKEG